MNNKPSNDKARLKLNSFMSHSPNELVGKLPYKKYLIGAVGLSLYLFLEIIVLSPSSFDTHSGFFSPLRLLFIIGLAIIYFLFNGLN